MHAQALCGRWNVDVEAGAAACIGGGDAEQPDRGEVDRDSDAARHWRAAGPEAEDQEEWSAALRTDDVHGVGGARDVGNQAALAHADGVQAVAVSDAVQAARAADLAEVVDTARAGEDPAGSGRDQVVEVRDRARRPVGCASVAAGILGLADDVVELVDASSFAPRTTEAAEGDHRHAVVDKAVEVACGIFAQSGHRALVVDCLGVAEGAAEVAELGHAGAVPSHRAPVTSRVLGEADDLTEVVDGAPVAVITAERAELDLARPVDQPGAEGRHEAAGNGHHSAHRPGSVDAISAAERKGAKVRIGHDAALPGVGVQRQAVDHRVADDLPGIVDVVAPGVGAAQCAEIMHGPGIMQEGMFGQAVGRQRRSRNLSEVVDVAGIGVAGGVQQAQVDDCIGLCRSRQQEEGDREETQQ